MAKRLAKFVCLCAYLLSILFPGIGLYVYSNIGINTTVPDAIDSTRHGINEPPDGSLADLIYNSERGIKIYNLSTNKSTSLVTQDPLVKAVSVDEEYIYWSSFWLGNSGIYRASRNSSEREVIAFRGIGLVQELAVDWMTGNIYFIDDDWRGIGVCTSTGSHCTLITTGEVTPRKLALHPTNGVVYYSTSESIVKSQMNGESQVPMLIDNFDRLTVLTIDYSTSKLYWVDERRSRIESINLDGTDEKTIFPFIGTVSCIRILGDRLFWNDLNEQSIYSCNKFTGYDRRILVQREGAINGFHVHNLTLKTDLNPWINNPCEEMRLLAADRTYTCACSFSKKLKDDGKTCERIKDRNNQHLIVAAGGVLYDYNHGVFGKPQLDRINDVHHFADIFNTTDMDLSSNLSHIIFNEFTRFFGVNGTRGDMVTSLKYTNRLSGNI